MHGLEKISEKIEQGERLSKNDGLMLSELRDIVSIGKLAHAVKKKKTGDLVFFNINCHINLTNICHSRCSFCAFSCDKDDPEAYTMSAEDVFEKAKEYFTPATTEVHMVSGLHPDLPFEYFVGVVEKLKNEFPSIHIKAFTPVEIRYFSDISGSSIENVLISLKKAGLGSMPGGGAEVLSDRIRQQLCPNKASSGDWLNIMKTAHRIGLKSNATLLFGHIETWEETIDHLIMLRELQDETGGFQAFIPLPFHSSNTLMGHIPKPTACEQLKIFSISRLMLDNFDHIKAYWIMLGLKIAQLSLFFGADDIDGTVVEEKITHAAGAETANGISIKELLCLIKQTGKQPVQRDTLYNVLETYR